MRIAFNFVPLALASFLALNSAPKSEAATPSIVNGTEATGREGWASSTVGLATRDARGALNIFCTGTILDSSTVVTAAHCLDEPLERVWVTFGLSEKAPNMALRKITRQTMHESYDTESDDDEVDIDDLGIVKFSDGLPPGYAPALILENEATLARGMEVLVAGYGVTDGKDQEESGTLRFAKLTVKNPNYGEKEVSLDEKEFASCNGDSGGPAMILVRGKWYLWGVISRGDTLCRKEGVYTRLSPYREWIAKQQ